jgi:hypothetical protein
MRYCLLPAAAIAGVLMLGCSDSARLTTPADPAGPTETSTAVATPLASAATVQHQTERFSFPAGGLNPCTGEETPGTGQFFSQSTVVAQPSGGFHVSQAFNVSYVLTGATTGDRYLGRDTEHVNFSTSGGADSVFTFVANVRVRTAGARNDFVLQIRVQQTVNANGVLTVARGKQTIVCR